jgi:hypothetical protein
MTGAGNDRAIVSGLGDMDRSDMKSFAVEQVGQRRPSMRVAPATRTT